MDEVTFKTLLKNERKTGVVLWDRFGSGIGLLGPGQSRTLEQWTPEALYAPFSEVFFKADGTVETTANPSFPPPKSRWTLRVLNRDGAELERRIIGHREVVLPHGLERTFGLRPEDSMAVYSRMEVRRVMERSEESENSEFPGYSKFRPVLKDIFIDRPEAELVELEAELKRLSEVTND